MISIPSFSQTDSRWANKLLGSSSFTMSDSGCYVAATAMLLANYGISETPGTLCDKLNSVNGFVDGQESYDAIGKLFPQTLFYSAVYTTNLNAPNTLRMQAEVALLKLQKLVKLGMCPILCVGLNTTPGTLNHAVVLYDAPDDRSQWRIKDPAFGSDDLFTKRYGAPITGVMGYRSIIGSPLYFPDNGLPSEGQVAWKLAMIKKGVNVQVNANEALDALIG